MVYFPRFFPGGGSSSVVFCVAPGSPGRQAGRPRPWVFSGNLLASGKPSETLKSWPVAEGMSTLGSMNDSLWRSLLDERLMFGDGWCVCFFWGGVGWEIGLGDGVCVCVSSVFVRFFVFFLDFLGLFEDILCMCGMAHIHRLLQWIFIHIPYPKPSPSHTWCLELWVWKPFLKSSEKTPYRRCEWVSL